MGIVLGEQREVALHLFSIVGSAKFTELESS